MRLASKTKMHQIHRVASESENKSSISVDVRDTDFPHVFFFNRYFLEKFDDDLLYASFGLVVSGNILGQCACIIPTDVVKHHEQRNLPYVDQIKTADFVNPKWTPQGQPSAVGVVDVMNFARIRNTAEMYFYRVIVNGVASAKANKEKDRLQGKPSLLLRSGVQIHCDFIKAMHLMP